MVWPLAGIAAEWAMLSQFWTRDHEKMKKRVIQADFVLTNLKNKKKTTGCVAYTEGKPRNAIAEDIYSCICHGEQRGCQVVLLSSKIGSSLCPAKLRKPLSILWV